MKKRHCTPPDVENATNWSVSAGYAKGQKVKQGESINKHVCGAGKHGNKQRNPESQQLKGYICEA
jgi:hypothetical protein